MKLINKIIDFFMGLFKKKNKVNPPVVVNTPTPTIVNPLLSEEDSVAKYAQDHGINGTQLGLFLFASSYYPPGITNAEKVDRFLHPEKYQQSSQEVESPQEVDNSHPVNTGNWPVITNAHKSPTGVWTTNQEEGKMAHSQHPGPQIGVTPDGDPVYGKK